MFGEDKTFCFIIFPLINLDKINSTDVIINNNNAVRVLLINIIATFKNDSNNALNLYVLKYTNIFSTVNVKYKTPTVL